MMFNKSGRQLKESYQFKYGATTIPSSKSYTYLGIVFTLSGSQQRTQQILRQKSIESVLWDEEIFHYKESTQKRNI